MRGFFRFIQRFDRKSYKRVTSTRQFQTGAKMASASTVVALYASAISASQRLGPKPEDAHELKHHKNGGKTFVNPWESFLDRSFREILLPIIL
jgi:hypothetical protein